MWFWYPHIGGGRFHDPPPLSPSIAATTKSHCYYMQAMQASDIYINSYVSWTLNNNFAYLVIWYGLKIVCEGLLFPSESYIVIVTFDLLTVEFFLIFFILRFPVSFIFDTSRFVCVHRLWSFERWKNLRQKRPQQRADLPLQKLTSREVAGEVFDALKLTIAWSIATFNAELTGKLVRRFHRYCAMLARKRRF